MRFFNPFTSTRTEIVRKKSIDVALCGRSERPQNRTDATPCLSDVYNIGTRARRRTANTILSGQTFFHRVLQICRDFLTTCTQKSTRGKKSQVDVTLCGRSMVEMLGVLAIIGVLSVGAMNGFNQAMQTIRYNKEIEQMNELFYTIYENKQLFIDSATNDGNQTYLIPLLTSLRMLPEGMDVQRNALYGVLGNRIVIFSRSTGTMGVYYYMLATGGKYSGNAKLCQLFFTNILKPNSALINHTVVYYGNQKTRTAWGDKDCNKASGLCIKDMTLSEIQTICPQPDDDDEYLPIIAVYF